MTELKGKVAAVTGAGSGIGRALALHLARKGCQVAAIDRDETAVRGTAGAAASGVRAYVVDMADADAVWNLADKVSTDFGRVDVLVNNAAIGLVPQPMLSRDLSSPHPLMERIRDLVEVNLLGVVHGTLAFLPHLAARPEGHLVNIASEAGLVGFAGLADYAMTKFGVRGFTEALQMELAGTPVKVTLVCPGATRTGIILNSPIIDDVTRANAQSALARAKGVMRPETAAVRIVRAIEAEKPRALLHPSTKFFSVVSRLAPGRYPALLAPVIRRLEDVTTKGE